MALLELPNPVIPRTVVDPPGLKSKLVHVSLNKRLEIARVERVSESGQVDEHLDNLRFVFWRDDGTSTGANPISFVYI